MNCHSRQLKSVQSTLFLTLNCIFEKYPHFSYYTVSLNKEKKGYCQEEEERHLNWVLSEQIAQSNTRHANERPLLFQHGSCRMLNLDPDCGGARYWRSAEQNSRGTEVDFEFTQRVKFYGDAQLRCIKFWPFRRHAYKIIKSFTE